MSTSIFWNWSNLVYADPRVKETCLQLQDQFGQNVNALLWVFWLAAKHNTSTSHALDLQQVICKGIEVQTTQGIRKARRELTSADDYSESPSATALKQSLLTLELMLEEHTQRKLEAIPIARAQTPHKIFSLARDNMDMFLAAQSLDDVKCARLTDHLCRILFTNPSLENSVN